MTKNELKKLKPGTIIRATREGKDYEYGIILLKRKIFWFGYRNSYTGFSFPPELAYFTLERENKTWEEIV
jgi:hypothetical protein